ncbi:MAG: DUF2461 domain-containing protein [Bacteroidales bacterium]|nr:DUF2461 domain-containing protein [Bacteroidales bacterium]MCF8337008.1 DUF2461 domain-containing protein [Bacteroidales bacterium]
MLSTTLQFLKQLRHNNNREWFERNRKLYEASQKELQDFLDDLIPRLGDIDFTIGVQKGKDCMFRIHRDLRFTKDKTPYKNYRDAIIKPGGRKSPYAGYYLHIEDGNSFIGGGMYKPQKANLDAVRNKIYFEHEDFRAILNSDIFRDYFGSPDPSFKLKRMPVGYSEEHPAADLLKYKSFIVLYPLEDEDLLDDDLTDVTLEVFQTMKPFNRFFNEAIDEKEEEWEL